MRCEIPLTFTGQRRPGHLDAFLRWVQILNPDTSLPFHEELITVAQHIINANEFVEKFSEAGIRLRDNSPRRHDIVRVTF